MLIRDRVSSSTRKTLPNGFVQVDAVFARTGIQLYSAGELGMRDRKPTDVIRVWRPAEEVFSADSMASFELVPVTDDHPADMVTVDNAKELTHGVTGDTVTRVGDNTKGRITLMTRTAIDKLLSGKEELSNGYDCDLEWTPGTVPAGQRDAGLSYDAIQRNIRGNHVAMVDAGRCGAECRILDREPPAPVNDKASCSCQGDEAMAEPALTKKMIDGIGLVALNDDAIAVIDKLTADLAAKDTAHAAALAAKDGEIAAKDAAHADALAAKDKLIEEAKAAIGDQASLDARVATRTKLVSDAKAIGGDTVVTDGKTDAEIKKAVVTAKFGDEKVKDKPDSFFDAAFDTLALSVGDDGGGRQQQHGAGPTLGDALRTPSNPSDRKPDSYEDRMAKRWKQEKAA